MDMEEMKAASDEIAGGLGLDLKVGDDAPTETDLPPEDADTATDTEVDTATDATATDTTPDASATGTPDPATPTPASDTAAAKPMHAPGSWRPEAKADWDKIPPNIQSEIHKREDDVLRGIGQYKQAADFGTRVDNALRPHYEILRQHNLDPVSHVGELLNAHRMLATGTPEQKAQMFRRLAQDYKIDLETLDPANDPYVHPEVSSLRNQVQALQSSQQQMMQAQQAETQKALTAEIDKFAADANNPHFPVVANDMALILRSGIVGTLKEAYDIAVAKNPELRAAAMQPVVQTPTPAVAAKTAAARKATGANVTAAGAANTKPFTAPKGSMEDSLSAAYDDIMRKA